MTVDTVCMYVCIDTLGLIFEISEIYWNFFGYWNIHVWNLINNFDWNIIEIEITKYKHRTELICSVPTLPVGLSDTQIGVCSVYVFMYGLRRLSRVEVSHESTPVVKCKSQYPLCLWIKLRPTCQRMHTMHRSSTDGGPWITLSATMHSTYMHSIYRSS